MFICLSSGSRPQYPDDVFRALALPGGAAIQFRYDKRYLTQATCTAVEKNDAAGQEALIVYVDQAAQDMPPGFVPCRYAKIKSVAEHGTTVSIELVVDDYAYADNLASFTQWLGQNLPNDLPKPHDGKIEGKYFLKASHPPASPVRTRQLKDWEQIVVQLAGRSDFTDESCFFTVRDIAVKGKPIASSDGMFKLDGGTTYEMRIYHYHPEKFAKHLQLQMSVADGCGISMLTNPTIRIDSRYDQKFVRFKTDRTPTQCNGFLTMSWVKEDGELHWLFDVPLTVKGAFWRSIFFAIALALFLAGPQIFTVWNNASLTTQHAIYATVISAVCGLLAGLFAVFGLKKSW